MQDSLENHNHTVDNLAGVGKVSIEDTLVDQEVDQEVDEDDDKDVEVRWCEFQVQLWDLALPPRNNQVSS